MGPRSALDERSPSEPGGRPRADWRAIYDRNPFLALGIVAGVGYILGGGLKTPLTRRVIKLGVKAFVMPALEEHLEGLIKDRQN